jgi:serine/threonine protein kinase
MQSCPNCGSAHLGSVSCPAGQAGVAAGTKSGSGSKQESGAAVEAQAAPAEAISMDPHIGQVLQGRYELLHVLGQGGMGTVYMARDLRLKGRSCVVKKLRDEFYREEDRQKAQAFFEREMQVLSELRHPNIVQILDFFLEGSDYYLVMEYVQGNNFFAMMQLERQGQPFPEKTVIDWVQQICEVLHHMHTQHPPVIYRDLKPSNIMIDLNNTVKLIDFGIARPYEESGDHTQVVSVGYSPPEQYWGGLDPRSDIYSLGATMHFLLTGKDPEALHVCSPRSINPDISPTVDAIVQQATAQNFNQRHQTIEEFMEALMHHDYVDAPNSTRSHIAEIATGLVILTIAAIIFLVEPLLQSDVHHKGDPPRTINHESDSATIDDRPSSGYIASHKSKHSRLAAEVIDEPDMTDPAGLTAPSNQQH